MDQHRNPINTSGYRNTMCGYYRLCLDHAVKSQWEYWACSECPYREKQEWGDVLMSRVNTDPFYSISPSLYKKMEIFSL